VLSGLSIFGNSGFKFSSGGSNHKNGNIGLRSSGNHVFDEISMSGSINDGETEFFGLKFPEGNIDGDSSFSFSLKFVQYPSVFEG